MLYIVIPTIYFTNLSVCSQLLFFLSTFFGLNLLRTYYNGPSNIYHPDLKGQFILVTGGTDGIGAECVREFAKLGAEVVFTGRDTKKANELISSIADKKFTLAHIKPKFRRCDFGDLKEVLDLVQWLNKDLGVSKIDVLLNNAGGFFTDCKKLTENGHGQTLQINHLGPMLLTSELLPLLLKGKSRVVNLSSLAGEDKSNPINLDEVLKDLDWGKKTGCLEQYNWSKMFNTLFASGLSSYVKKAKLGDLKSVSVHPGVIGTGFGRQLHPLLRLIIIVTPFFSMVAKELSHGAATSLHCCLCP